MPRPPLPNTREDRPIVSEKVTTASLNHSLTRGHHRPGLQVPPAHNASGDYTSGKREIVPEGWVLARTNQVRTICKYTSEAKPPHQGWHGAFLEVADEAASGLHGQIESKIDG